MLLNSNLESSECVILSLQCAPHFCDRNSAHYSRAAEVECPPSMHIFLFVPQKSAEGGSGNVIVLSLGERIFWSLPEVSMIARNTS